MKATIRSGQLQKGLGFKKTVVKNINGYFVDPGDELMSLVSPYSSGILCAGLLDKCRVIIDYANRRIAFTPASLEKTEGGPTQKKLVKHQQTVNTNWWKRWGSVIWLAFFCSSLLADLVKYILKLAPGLPFFHQ